MQEWRFFPANKEHTTRVYFIFVQGEIQNEIAFQQNYSVCFQECTRLSP